MESLTADRKHFQDIRSASVTIKDPKVNSSVEMTSFMSKENLIDN